MDKTNATLFINSYNKIDAQLRQLYNFKPSQSFSDMVRRSAEENAVIRKYENDLMDFARLRNAIVHQSTDGRIIAVPCDEVVEEMQLIEKLLCTPPKIGDTMKPKKIVSVDDAAQATSRLRGIVEKPDPSVAPSRLAVIGRYVFEPEIFRYLAEVKPGVGGEIQLTDAIEASLEDVPSYAHRYSGTRFDCGSKQGFIDATVHYARKRGFRID